MQFPVAGFFAIAQVFLLPGMFESGLMAVACKKDTYCMSLSARNDVDLFENAQVYRSQETEFKDRLANLLT